MEAASTGQKTVDQLIIFRARMLLFAAFAFALWQAGWIVMDMIGDKTMLTYKVAGWSSVVGAVCWAIASFLFIKFSRQMKQSNACSALHDELTVKNRNMAFAKSYFILIGLVWVLIPALGFWSLNIEYVLRSLAIIGISLPMILFSLCEIKNYEGAE